MTLLVLVFVAALAFEFINGFHDTANSIATVVSTRVLTPRHAIILASAFNLLGAMAGTAVAATIGKGMIDSQFITTEVILYGLIAGIIWNLITWRYGIPSSSSHALIGGLCGAALANAANNWDVVIWYSHNPVTGAYEGVIPKIIIPMFISPLFGLIIGFVVMGCFLVLLRKTRPVLVNRTFGKLQIFSASWMAFSHGTNDAQKTMGIITLALVTATQAGVLSDLPELLGFLHMENFSTVPMWVKLLCAITMAAGTAAGGWRIIRTLGHKMVKLQPIHGFAAETAAASIIQVASHWGIPLSTTHVISSSIMGVGATKRLNAVKWPVVRSMVTAWALTLPIAGGLGYLLTQIFHT
jgi:PiT family inorganic phosphate transporter